MLFYDFFVNKSIIYFVKIVKISYHRYPPPITAHANKGQSLQVPSRLLSRGYAASRQKRRRSYHWKRIDMYYFWNALTVGKLLVDSQLNFVIASGGQKKTNLLKSSPFDDTGFTSWTCAAYGLCGMECALVQ